MAVAKDDLLTIGALAARSGVAPSALRFYESIGLIGSERSPGGHRLFPGRSHNAVAIDQDLKLGLPLRKAPGHCMSARHKIGKSRLACISMRDC